MSRLTPSRILAPVTLGLLLLLAACSDSDSGQYNLVTDGHLTVCTDAPYEPFEFQAEDGSWSGFDMDILRALAAALELELTVKVVPFDGIWLLPAAGDCDIVGSAMTITPERQQAALFSDPYFDADQSLLVRTADSSTFATLEALAGHNIGVQTGTTGELFAQEHQPEGSTLVSFDEPAAMFLALEAGDIDAILQDLPVNGFRSTKDDSFVVTATFPTGEQYGFAVDPENTELMDAINKQLAELHTSGDYDEIHTKWFG